MVFGCVNVVAALMVFINRKIWRHFSGTRKVGEFRRCFTVHGWRVYRRRLGTSECDIGKEEIGYK